MCCISSGYRVLQKGLKKKNEILLIEELPEEPLKAVKELTQ